MDSIFDDVLKNYPDMRFAKNASIFFLALGLIPHFSKQVIDTTASRISIHRSTSFCMTQEAMTPSLPFFTSPLELKVRVHALQDVMTNTLLEEIAEATPSSLIAATGLPQRICVLLQEALRSQRQRGLSPLNLETTLATLPLDSGSKSEIYRRLIKYGPTMELEFQKELSVGVGHARILPDLHHNTPTELVMVPAEPLSPLEKWRHIIFDSGSNRGIAIYHPSLGQAYLYPDVDDSENPKVIVTWASGLSKKYRLNFLVNSLSIDRSRPTLAIESNRFSVRQARHYYYSRQSLQFKDHLMLAQKLSDVLDPVALEWVASLWREWPGPTTREEQQQLLDALQNGVGKHHPELSNAFIGLIQIKPLLDEALQSNPSLLGREWTHLTDDQAKIRIVLHGIRRAQEKTGRTLIYFDEAREAIGLTKMQWTHFLRQMEERYRLTPLAFSVVRTHLTDTDVLAAVWEARRTPEGIAWLDDVAKKLRRTRRQFLATVGVPPLELRKQNVSPTKYLLDRWQILPEQLWCDVLLSNPLSEKPTPFEKHVMKTFLRILKRRKPILQLVDRDFVAGFDIGNRHISMERFMVIMREHREHNSALIYILKRYGVLDEKFDFPSWDTIRTLNDFRPLWVNHFIRRVPWAFLHEDLIEEILNAYAHQLGKSGFIEAITEGRDYFTISLHSFSERPISMSGFYNWAVSLRRQAINQSTWPVDLMTPTYIAKRFIRKTSTAS